MAKKKRTKKASWGDRVTHSIDKREGRSQQAIKVRGDEVFSRNDQGGLATRVVGRDLIPNRDYVLEKRWFWWVLIGETHEQA